MIDPSDRKIFSHGRMNFLRHMILRQHGDCQEYFLIDCVISDEIVGRLVASCHVVDSIKIQFSVFLQLIAVLNLKIAVAELMDEVFTDVSQRNHIIKILLQLSQHNSVLVGL